MATLDQLVSSLQLQRPYIKDKTLREEFNRKLEELKQNKPKKEEFKKRMDGIKVQEFGKLGTVIGESETMLRIQWDNGNESLLPKTGIKSGEIKILKKQECSHCWCEEYGASGKMEQCCKCNRIIMS
jgi:hypothetical protein